MIVYGTRLYGKIDEVPGLFHVATKFTHIDYLPLIPNGSLLVLSKSGRQYSGVKIPLSLKSILVAWTRAASIAGIIIGIGFFLITLSDRHSNGADPMLLGIGLLSTVVLIASYYVPFITRASWERACELGKLAQLTDTGWKPLGDAYGRVVPPGGVSFGFPVTQVRAAIPIEDQNAR